MIELKKTDLRSAFRQSSKGNQLKFEKKGYWYKADYTGYEGLAEYIISELLKRTNLMPDEYVTYETEEIRYENTTLRGCKSKGFLDPGTQIITLERLYKNKTGESLQKTIWRIHDDDRRRLRFLVDNVEAMTGLADFGSYMAKLITIDAFFLNEDRHLHNIAVLLTDSDTYKLCPIFDQGAALLADTTLDYPIGIDPHEFYPKVRAKTFHSDFDVQLDIAEELYGETIHFLFSKKEAEGILADEPYYPKEIKDRVRDILFHQMEKYGYLVG